MHPFHYDGVACMPEASLHESRVTSTPPASQATSALQRPSLHLCCSSTAPQTSQAERSKYSFPSTATSNRARLYSHQTPATMVPPTSHCCSTPSLTPDHRLSASFPRTRTPPPQLPNSAHPPRPACTTPSAPTSALHNQHPPKPAHPTSSCNPRTPSKPVSRNGALNKNHSRWRCCVGSSVSRSP